MEMHAGPGGPPEPQGPPPSPSGLPPEPQGPPGEPRASRITTIALITALVLAVLVTGVLGTIAVLMTRNPDMPLGAPPPRKLAAPSTSPRSPGRSRGLRDPDSYPDDAGQVCYTVAPGVEISSVREIEAVRETTGAYSVRIAFAPASRDQINSVTEEADGQQLAIVVGGRVVAAPASGR
nr:hypothetical protein GCM10020093_110630 [Planobispora longispora]